MGCDIHLYTERKHKINRDGNEQEIWICADYYKINPYYYNYPEEENKMNIVHIYDGRNYALFETLAGVRAYYGNGIMSEPKGLPDDVSREVKKESECWGIDGHSHSWFTAKELFDWKEAHNIIRYSGMISSEQAADLDKGITPTSWCQWTNQSGYVQREWTEKGCVLDSLIDAVKKRMSEIYYIYDFLSEEEKEKRYKNCAENFRIVFWFDN